MAEHVRSGAPELPASWNIVFGVTARAALLLSREKLIDTGQ
jgi:hypothetical protein